MPHEAPDSRTSARLQAETLIHLRHRQEMLRDIGHPSSDQSYIANELNDLDPVLFEYPQYRLAILANLPANVG